MRWARQTKNSTMFNSKDILASLVHALARPLCTALVQMPFMFIFTRIFLSCCGGKWSEPALVQVTSPCAARVRNISSLISLLLNIVL